LSLSLLELFVKMNERLSLHKEPHEFKMLQELHKRTRNFDQILKFMLSRRHY
jgi:hypothetical protein